MSFTAILMLQASGLFGFFAGWGLVDKKYLQAAASFTVALGLALIGSSI